MSSKVRVEAKDLQKFTEKVIRTPGREGGSWQACGRRNQRRTPRKLRAGKLPQ